MTITDHHTRYHHTPVEITVTISNPSDFPGPESQWGGVMYRHRNNENVHVHTWQGISSDPNGFSFRLGTFDLSDAIRIEILPRSQLMNIAGGPRLVAGVFGQQDHNYYGASDLNSSIAQSGYHVTMPLISMGLVKYQHWRGTTAVYAKAQYPSVDPAFYFTNAITLGQQVKPNVMPNIRVSVHNKQMPPDPPHPDKRAPYYSRLVGSVAFYRLQWANQQEGVFDALLDGDIYPSPVDQGDDDENSAMIQVNHNSENNHGLNNMLLQAGEVFGEAPNS